MSTRRTIRSPALVFAALVGLVCPTPAVSQDQRFLSLTQDMREREFVQVTDKLMAAVRAMPADRYSYRATPELRTFAEELNHVADVNFRLCGLAAGGRRPQSTGDARPAEKAEVIDRLSASLEQCRSALDALDDRTALEPTFGPYIRGSHVTAMLGHNWHEYGKITVILRLNGLTPPP